MIDDFTSWAVAAGALIGPSAGLSGGSVSALSLGSISFAIGAAAFALLFAAVVFKTRHSATGFVLMALCATAAWTACSAAYYAGLPIRRTAIPALEIVRFLTWFGFLTYLLLRDRMAGRPATPPPIVGVIAVGVASIGLAALAWRSGLGLMPSGVNLHPLVGLVAAVAGLLATEMLYRNTPAGQRWKIKLLCLSTGVFFAYDLFLYADAALFRAVDPALQEARGAVQALCAPLFAIAAVRTEIWRTRISLSRKVAMGSTTLIATGIYLMLAAAIGFWFREAGARPGNVIQVVFLVGALAVLAVTLFSGAYWAHVRILVSRHFFEHKYDWREEWLRFMGTLASVHDAPLEERCVKAIADIVDSPGGAMILIDKTHASHAATWNFSVPELTPDRAFVFCTTLKESQAVIDLEQLRAGGEVRGAEAVPEELLDLRRAWLVVPLWHRRLVGLVILEQPRAARSLGWEDYDLLGVVGRQVASYLAEQRAQEALEEAREFEIFNRRFAFVVHDVKNLVSQLSVLGSNFEKHGHRQAFRDDAVASLNDAAAMMKRLMARIGAFQPKETVKTEWALQPIIQKVVAAQPERDPELIVECDAPETTVLGDPDRLEAMIAHLVQNAVDVAKGGAAVRIILHDDGRFAVLDVIDDGPGMAPEYVQRELFRPFQSTKKSGMGIGVYQCREYAREFGGNLEAISAPGEGTTMRVTLPVAGGTE